MHIKRRQIYFLLALFIATLCYFFSLDYTTLLINSATAQTIPMDSSDAVILEQQGKTLYDAGQFQEAELILREAAQVYQSTGNTLRQAVVLGNLSLIYQRLGRWDDANQSIQTCLLLLHGNYQSDVSEQILTARAQALGIQGGLLFAQGQLQQALIVWHQATRISEQLNDEMESIHNRINEAQALQALGNYQYATEILIDVQQAIQDVPDSPLVVVTLRNLGDTLQVTGDLEQSYQLLEQSLEIAQRLRMTESIASAQLSLGNLARIQQDTETALEFYRQAARSNPSALIYVQSRLNELSVLVDTQSWLEAQQLWPSLWENANRLPLSREALEARINLVQNLLRLKQLTGVVFPDWQLLIQLMAETQHQAEILGDSRSRVYALGLLGQLYEQNQEWTAAESFTRQALQLAQVNQPLDSVYLWQWQLGRILKCQSHREEALESYNSAFVALQTLRRDVVTTNPSFQLRFRTQAEEPVYREYIDLLLQSAVPSQADLQRTREVITSLQVAELENFLQVPCLEGTPELTDHVVDEHDFTAAVIYPILLTDRLEVIVRLPRDPILYHYRNSNTTATQVQQLLKQLKNDLEKEYTFRAVEIESQQLYQWLIQPFEEHLERVDVKTLVFVLTGALRNSSMAALYDGNDYLIKRYAIAVVPGTEIVEPEPLVREDIKILGAYLTEPPETLNLHFPSLTYVDDELAQIQQTGLPLTLLRDTQFTRSAFNSALTKKSFKVVHLATHGQFSSNSEETFVLAADGEIKVADLSTVFRSRGQIRPDAIELLVLSACETATGDDLATLGIAGTTVRADVRSTIAALWSLDDQSSVEFTKQFYEIIGKPNVSKAKALQHAQQALLNNPQYKHPRYWAGYVLVGNWL